MTNQTKRSIINKTMLDLILQDRNLSGNSFNWANWISKLSLKTCLSCAKNHGKIFALPLLKADEKPPLHFLCQCSIVAMRTKKSGTVTNEGISGADVYVLIYKQLPNQYITKASAQKAGWKSSQGNLQNVLPGKVIGGDIYQNREEKLPSTPGRVWYEADINYTDGFRGRERLLYSNDGLIFASYDHYKTFYEVTK